MFVCLSTCKKKLFVSQVSYRHKQTLLDIHSNQLISIFAYTSENDKSCGTSTTFLRWQVCGSRIHTHHTNTHASIDLHKYNYTHIFANMCALSLALAHRSPARAHSFTLLLSLTHSHTSPRSHAYSISVTLLIHFCDLAHIYLCDKQFIFYMSCGSWVHTCDTTRPCSLAGLIRVTSLILCVVGGYVCVCLCVPNRKGSHERSQ